MVDLIWWLNISSANNQISGHTTHSASARPYYLPRNTLYQRAFLQFSAFDQFWKNDFPFSYSSFSVLYVFSLFSLTLDIRTRNLVDNPKSQTHTGCNKQLQKLVTKKTFISAEKFFFLLLVGLENADVLSSDFFASGFRFVDFSSEWVHLAADIVEFLYD